METRSGLSIRQAAAGEAEQLLALVRAYWEFEALPGYDRRAVLRQLRRMLAAPAHAAAWLAADDEGPVGYLLAVYVYSLEHLGLTAEIDELYVLPRARGAGVGGRLLAAAEAEFAARGCTNVSLQLGRDNEAARAFYGRRGYGPRAGFELLDKMLPGP